MTMTMNMNMEKWSSWLLSLQIWNKQTKKKKPLRSKEFHHFCPKNIGLISNLDFFSYPTFTSGWHCHSQKIICNWNCWNFLILTMKCGSWKINNELNRRSIRDFLNNVSYKNVARIAPSPKNIPVGTLQERRNKWIPVL